MARLSNIELYYTAFIDAEKRIIKLVDDEFNHAAKVMRHNVADTLFITDGDGSIFRTKITSIKRDEISAEIIETEKTENKYSNIHFCIPKLKNPDRFKFALEKCVELGITNFLVYESERTIAKGSNLKRWQKITLSAMKQSLRAYLPVIKILNNISEIVELQGSKIVFEQNCVKDFRVEKLSKHDCYLVFGPEGGLTESEIDLFGSECCFFLSDHRLRSETAIVKAASLLNSKILLK